MILFLKEEFIKARHAKLSTEESAKYMLMLAETRQGGSMRLMIDDHCLHSCIVNKSSL
jgi:hypothetical protein